MPEPKQFDHYLADDGPAALVIREWLMPVEGADGVLFPSTYAAGDNFAGGYNIDGDPHGANVCLIDSVGSQANRIEPLFAEEKYRHLVPQIEVQVTADKSVSLLEAGHRAGDALVRCSSLQQALQDAFKSVLRGDAQPLAKVAPTSLVFGVWDSRDTQAKLPRVVASTIRAFNVRKLTRSAQFNPAAEYVNDKLLDEPTDKATKDAYAERGFIHVPASGSHGGVIATGGVRRDATLGLAAIRLLFAGQDDKKTVSLRRYILGLALTAFTHNPAGYLRQGCLLVKNPEKAKENEFVEVYPNGERKPLMVTHGEAIQYATDAAKTFGVGHDFEKLYGAGERKLGAVARGKTSTDSDFVALTVDFDKDRAKRDVSGETAEEGNVSGQISKVTAGSKKFTIGKGAGKIEVKTSAETMYLKGDASLTFEEVVRKNVIVEVELANGTAVKVTAK